MTLARTAVRLQAIELLNADPVVGAACNGRIFDSRLAELSHEEPVPVIVVTTEETKAEGSRLSDSASPTEIACDLVLEIAMDAVAQDADGNVGTFIPATDRELEAALDVIEEAAIAAVIYGQTAPARLMRQAVILGVPEYKSSRFATDDTGEKLAIRLVTLRVRLRSDDPDILNPPTGPFAGLPNPLRTVAEHLPAGSSALATCARIAGMLTGQAFVPFTGVDARISPATDRPADSAPIGTPGRPVGPSQPDFGVTLDPPST